MNYIPITVLVDEDRVPQFYRLHADFINSVSEATALPAETAAGSTTVLARWDASNADAELIRKTYEGMSDQARQVYDLLFRTAPHTLTPDEISATFGLSTEQLWATLSWPTKRANQAGKVSIHQQDNDGGLYIPQDVAHIFRAALAIHEDDLIDIEHVDEMFAQNAASTGENKADQDAAPRDVLGIVEQVVLAATEPLPMKTLAAKVQKEVNKRPNLRSSNSTYYVYAKRLADAGRIARIKIGGKLHYTRP